MNETTNETVNEEKVESRTGSPFADAMLNALAFLRHLDISEELATIDVKKDQVKVTVSATKLTPDQLSALGKCWGYSYEDTRFAGSGDVNSYGGSLVLTERKGILKLVIRVEQFFTRAPGKKEA